MPLLESKGDSETLLGVVQPFTPVKATMKDVGMQLRFQVTE